MADTRQRTTWGNRFRFMARAFGLIGVLTAATGLCLLWAEFRTFNAFSLERLRDYVQGNHGEFAKTAAWTFALGAVAAVLVACLELVSAVFFSGSRRTAAGGIATLGIIAALALLIITNIYSFKHYGRHDYTHDQRFTLPPDLVTDLGKLRANTPTTIVVLQQHNTFGNLPTKRDSFTSAAERQVTEKVRDLVDQFREFGPQFNVVVLDTEAFKYEEQLKELTKDAPELKDAIKASPENSIFFHANKRVQRLAFNEFMQLDKTASAAADDGRANLVLVPQGIDRFARRIFAVQERRPKVAVCVVHELLTTAADDPKNRFTMAGLRKALTEHGFDVVDVVLRKGWASARSISDIKPAADTREESKLERLEGELDDADAELTSARTELRQFETIRDLMNAVKGRPWEERKAVYMRFTRGTPTEEGEPNLFADLAKRLKRAQDKIEEATKKKQEAEKALTDALKDERSLQDRRTADVSAKFRKQLVDVDLIVVPRFTVEDAMKGSGVEANLHALSREQAKVAKEFMKQGKPVLACLGPITPQVIPQPGEPPEEFDKRLNNELAPLPDEFEKMLTERGVELGRGVVLFEGEPRAITRAGQFGSNPSEVPPVTFADEPAPESKFRPNPIAAAYRLTGRTAGQSSDPAAPQPAEASAEKKFEIKPRALRTVALLPGWQAKQPFAAEIAFTSADSWNTLQPYPAFDRLGRPARVPKYTPTGLDDPRKGTRDEERRGPFSFAVAVENKIPVAWMTEDALATDPGPLRSPYERHQAVAAVFAPLDGTLAAALTVAADKVERPTQRTVVFGSGTMFNGAKLEAPEEKLLVHTANWLTNREDRLPKPAANDNPEWRYPRVALSDRNRELWRLAAFPGLPLVVGVFGLFVMMLRRMR